jgi:hypothetical protein
MTAKSRAEVPAPQAASETPNPVLVVHTRYQRGLATKSCEYSVRGRDRRTNAKVSVQNTEFRLEFRHKRIGANMVCRIRQIDPRC